MKAINLIPALSLVVPAIAYAQPDAQSIDTSADFDHQVAAPSNAFELGIGAGYSQGVGKLGGGMSNVQDVASAGGSVEVDAGWRIAPHVSVGGYATFADWAPGDHVNNDNTLLGATAGVQAVLHVRPDRSVDPWVSVGTGWKGLWQDPQQGKVTSLQGLELARLQIGVDYRVNDDVSISPVIGGSLGMYLSDDSPMTTQFTEIADKQVNFTGFAGLAGRFDLGGKR
jgi:hypothetical protein